MPDRACDRSGRQMKPSSREYQLRTTLSVNAEPRGEDSVVHQHASYVDVARYLPHVRPPRVSHGAGNGIATYGAWPASADRNSPRFAQCWAARGAPGSELCTMALLPLHTTVCCLPSRARSDQPALVAGTLMSCEGTAARGMACAWQSTASGPLRLSDVWLLLPPRAQALVMCARVCTALSVTDVLTRTAACRAAATLATRWTATSRSRYAARAKHIQRSQGRRAYQHTCAHAVTDRLLLW